MKIILSVILLLVWVNTGLNAQSTFNTDKLACDGGNYAMCERLGLRYSKGVGVKKNYSKAWKLFIKSCNGGFAPACRDVGMLYGKGEQGIKKNYSNARKYLTKSCSGGWAQACSDLGWMYFKGLGVKSNNSKALKLFKKACNAGNADGCNKYNGLRRNSDPFTLD